MSPHEPACPVNEFLQSLKVDRHDGIPYTKDEFLSFYGTEQGCQLWHQAQPLQDWPAYLAGLRMAIDAARRNYLQAAWTHYAMLSHTLPCPPSWLAAAGMQPPPGLYPTYSTVPDTMYSTFPSRKPSSMRPSAKRPRATSGSKVRFQAGPRPAPGLELPSIREAVWLAPNSSNCARSEVVRALRQRLGLTPSLEL